MNPIVLSIPIFFLLIFIEVIYGYFSNKKIYRAGDAFANIGCGIFEQTTGLFISVFTIGLYTLVYEFRVFEIPTTWPYLILLFFIVDFQYYWAHRMSHQVNLFWIGHVIHHQSEDYNLSVALRQGALQKIFTAPFALPAALLGFDPYWFLFISALNTLYQFWIHTETIGKMGWFEYVFNTPSHHRVHHGRDPKYIDKNHAGSLIIWDKMFGTFQAEEERPHYGITKETHTFNPIMAHIKPIQQLNDDLKKVRGFDKVKLLFKGPGWFPKKNGGPQLPPKVPKDYLKFDVPINAKLQVYGVVQFIISLGFVAAYLFFQSNFNLNQQILGSIWIVLSLFSTGAIFQMSKGFVILEILKWILLVYILGQIEPNSTLYYSAMVLMAASLTYFLTNEKKLTHVQ